jgi:hypothetical protein
MRSDLAPQGLDFQVEPQSVSGEAELVAPERVLDAKLFDGDSSRHGKRYMLHGVNLLTYIRDSRCASTRPPPQSEARSKHGWPHGREVRWRLSDDAETRHMDKPCLSGRQLHGGLGSA